MICVFFKKGDRNSTLMSTTIIKVIFKATTMTFRQIFVALGPFKHYVSKEVGGWGQKMAIFSDLQ